MKRLLLAGAIAVSFGLATSLATAQNIPCSKPQGGASWLAASGCVFDGDGQVDVFVLDADGDTTISSPTDDTIDIEIAGADDFTFTANTFTALSGSSFVSPTYDAAGATAITIGSVDVTAVTITTDSAGDAEVVLPAQSISGTEMVNNTVTAVQTSNTLCLQIISVEIDPTEASGTLDYVNLVDNSFSTTEGNEDMFRVPVATTAHNLSAVVATAPGAGNDPWAVTLRDDGSDTTLTCTIDETATTCVDSSNTPTIGITSLLNILVDSTGGDADPTATASITISFCLGQ